MDEDFWGKKKHAEVLEDRPVFGIDWEPPRYVQFCYNDQVVSGQLDKNTSFYIGLDTSDEGITVYIKRHITQFKIIRP